MKDRPQGGDCILEDAPLFTDTSPGSTGRCPGLPTCLNNLHPPVLEHHWFLHLIFPMKGDVGGRTVCHGPSSSFRGPKGSVHISVHLSPTHTDCGIGLTFTALPPGIRCGGGGFLLLNRLVCDTWLLQLWQSHTVPCAHLGKPTCTACWSPFLLSTPRV